ncbi:MAG: hypothetical protein ACJ72N_14035 [Labedaea sp.]
MHAWRLFAAALLAAGGLVLVLLTMAKTRERRGATGATVALSGVITFTVLGVLCLLVATVLPAWLSWSVVALVGATVAVMTLAS